MPTRMQQNAAVIPAEDVEHTATDALRPYWQTEPCPHWCTGPHEDPDAVEDRDHCGASLEIPTRLLPAVHVGDNVWERATWKVYLRRSQDSTLTRVHLYNDDREHKWAEFTADEAEDLRDALAVALQQVFDAQTADVTPRG